MRVSSAMLILIASLAAPTSAQQGTRETFDSAPAGWELTADQERGAEVRDGSLVIWVDNSARAYQPITVRVPGEHRDVSVEAEVRKLSGKPGTGIGLLCRDGAQGRYFADVDEEGEVRIGANLEKQKVLGRADRPGVWRKGVNTLRLDCIGSTIALWVNGERVLTAEDTTLTSGAVALRAGGAGSGRTEAAFDSLVVTSR